MEKSRRAFVTKRLLCYVKLNIIYFVVTNALCALIACARAFMRVRARLAKASAFACVGVRPESAESCKNFFFACKYFLVLALYGAKPERLRNRSAYLTKCINYYA